MADRDLLAKLAGAGKASALAAWPASALTMLDPLIGWPLVFLSRAAWPILDLEALGDRAPGRDCTEQHAGVSGA